MKARQALVFERFRSVPGAHSEEPPLLGGGLSAAGAGIQQREAEANAQRARDARNRELQRTMARNDPLAQQGRDTFNTRVQQASESADTGADSAATERQGQLETAASETGGALDVPLSGSAPSVVQGEIAKRIGEAVTQGKSQALSLAKLGGYGDSFLKQGLLDSGAQRDIGVTNNLANGNLAIMPYAQDFAEQAAYKPSSGLGAILGGLGSIVGASAGGTGAKKYTSFLGGGG